MSVGGSPDDEVDQVLEEAGSRRSRILGGPRRGRPEGKRAVWIAVLSTVVFFTVLGIAIINAPGWLEVKEAFFNGEQFKESFPSIARAFLVNVKLFLIAEVFILVLAMFLAVMRSLPGPVFFPITGARRRIHRPVPRHPHGARHLHARVRGSRTR